MTDIVYEPSLYYRYYPSSYVGWVINWVIGIIQTLLALRFILEFFGANSASQFVAWIYGITAGLLGPFAGAFPSISFGMFVVDVSTLFAMIGYAIIGWLLVRVLSFFFEAVERI